MPRLPRILLLPLVLVAGCMGALGVANESPNAIRVQTALPAGAAYEAAVAAARDAGYTVAHSDAALRTFETARLVRDGVAVTITGAVEGEARAVVVLEGRFAVPGVCDEGPIRRVGESGCPALRAWAELEGVAARIEGVATPVVLE